VEVAEVAENIAWCRCHASDKSPRCDGSHRQFWANPEKPPRKPGKD